ncbi:MAG: hypothetical protein HFF16_08785 [Angelakisella sp.]|jgi:hypothetical protein|nr:hypothetical protein [Angelakisella sp.]
MPDRKMFRSIAWVMLIAAVIFLVYAVTHPTASFPWSNAITYTLYAVYILVMLVLFVASRKKGK